MLKLYIAETVVFAASRPDHVNIADVLIYPVNQASKIFLFSFFIYFILFFFYYIFREQLQPFIDHY
jgi:hypothetical protein